jgi:hypothetical protein
MSRTNIATQVPVGPYLAGGSVSANALDLVWIAADITNFNESSAVCQPQNPPCSHGRMFYLVRSEIKAKIVLD